MFSFILFVLFGLFVYGLVRVLTALLFAARPGQNGGARPDPFIRPGSARGGEKDISRQVRVIEEKTPDPPAE